MPATMVARVYAETLLRLAEREGAIEPVTDSLETVARTIGADDRFRRFLEAPQIPAEEKRAVLREAFEGRLHPVAVRFLDLVAGRHRESLLPEIVAVWREILDRRANRQSATVTTAAPAEREIIAALQRALERATGKHIVLEERLDPTLLGGIVVRTGDLLMDASLRTRLAMLRHRLRTSRRGRG